MPLYVKLVYCWHEHKKVRPKAGNKKQLLSLPGWNYSTLGINSSEKKMKVFNIDRMISILFQLVEQTLVAR